MSPLDALSTLGGVAEWSTLAELGVTRTALNSEISSRAVIRVRRGCYALPRTPATRVAEVAWRGTLACVSALRLWGLPVLSDDTRIHLAVRPHRSYSGRNLRPPATICPHQVPVVAAGAAWAVDSSSTCLSRLGQLVALDAALNRGLLGRSEIGTFTVTPARRVAWLRAQCDANAQSLLETITRTALRAARLRVESQVSIAGVGRVDLLVDGRVIVELDGREYHSDPAAFAEDRRRDRAAQLLGYVVLRFTYAEVMSGTATVVRSVREALRRVPMSRIRRWNG